MNRLHVDTKAAAQNNQGTALGIWESEAKKLVKQIRKAFRWDSRINLTIVWSPYMLQNRPRPYVGTHRLVYTLTAQKKKAMVNVDLSHGFILRAIAYGFEAIISDLWVQVKE